MNREGTRRALLAEAKDIRSQYLRANDPAEKKRLAAKYRQIDYELAELNAPPPTIPPSPQTRVPFVCVPLPSSPNTSPAKRTSLGALFLIFAAVIIWLVIVAGGNPDAAKVESPRQTDTPRYEPPKYVTFQQYQEVSDGMSHGAVDKIMGMPGKLRESRMIDGRSYNIYVWPGKQPDSGAIVVFSWEGVSEKAQKGL